MKIFTTILISLLLTIIVCQKTSIEIELRKIKFSSISSNMDINQKNHRQSILQDHSQSNEQDHTEPIAQDKSSEEKTTQQQYPENFEGMEPLKLQTCNKECINCGGICCIPSQCKSNIQCIEECS